ncbi:repeat [uncultured Roseburia sp.]|uniref:InlB B-repeat-containing protein n=1 Tax=Brotonthovivens ammoniilytica TaxID=2981725 RepID=A0ABT2TH52_9FIRM|nr:InlB B-repeat-containing protein [Brotonthovivens ammoniilytica]MCU6761523.1 InlB B-repeat-containing protein [Brotonthovivens ammoniilytica]SCI30915.1 repeat [uncultured Roseburia sp.]
MKRNKSKQMLAWVLAAGMAGSCMSMTAFAKDAPALPESSHDYDKNHDQTWSYTAENAANGVYVTFNKDTNVESGYDFIYVLDGNGNEIGKYTGTELAGKTVYVPTATVQIRLTSDQSGNAWGFKVDSIEACGEKVDLARVGSVDEIAPVEAGEEISVVVRVNGKELVQDTDYKVTYDSSQVGNSSATITGTGKYEGTLSADFHVYDDDNKVEGAKVKSAQSSLRLTSEKGSARIQFENIGSAWASSIESVTLKPVNKDGSPTVAEDAYPNGPKEITLTKDQISVSGNYLTFERTAENPVVYVMEGHEPLAVTGRWSTVTYPQSQIYEVTVKAKGYEDSVGETTWYTGTAPAFSIIEDQDGNPDTTADQVVVKSWSSDDMKAMSEFLNGSSQCGMTGFRTFSGNGVSLNDLLKEAGVTVSDDDYFLLDTSDHYGNNFTYDELFNTTRYFLSTIYDDDFADYYDSLVSDGGDADAGSTIALRRYLAEKCLEKDSTVDPSICTEYEEDLISGDAIRDAELPTAANTNLNPLIAYENQFRFVYGIALTKDECDVTFDTQGGSEVEDQTVLSHLMTSTSNTTIKSSYWANSLVIYRGAGEEYKTEPSTAAETISVPETPEKEGYVFGGWYTDEECTAGNKFDFRANDSTVDQDTTLYAKWIKEDAAVSVTDFDITNAEHDDADGELNQTIIATLTFSEDIKLTSDDLSKDLLITIAGGDVNNTARDITYEVKNGNQLVITMVSNDWAAIYNGMLSVQEAAGGITHIVAADDSSKTVVVPNQESRIPIGIVLNNDAVAGTDKTAASTYVSVAHKANMRGMYFFELVSIVDGEETVIGSGVSHAHNFSTTVDEAAIAQAMAEAVNGEGFDGYSAVYKEGDTSFVVTADKAVKGQVLAMRMMEDDAAINYAHAPSDVVVENRVEATEKTDGSYDNVTYCTFCKQELDRETIAIPATGTNDPSDNQKPGTSDPSDNQNGNGSGNQNVNGSGNGSNNQSSVSPKTGDNSMAGVWTAVFAAAGVGAAAAFRKRKPVK